MTTNPPQRLVHVGGNAFGNDPNRAPVPDRQELRARIAAVLREHGSPAHIGGMPADEYECCADAVLDALAGHHAAGAAPRPGYGMSARANKAGRCVVCDGVTCVCQVCHKPRHDDGADHKLSLLPCRECNGGSYPVRRRPADDTEA